MFVIQQHQQNYIPIGKSIKTPFFRFQRRCEQMDPYPLNTDFLKNNFFKPKSLLNAFTANKRLCRGHNVPPHRLKYTLFL